MKRIFRINPDYASYGDFVRRIPDIFEKEGRTVYDERNKIKVFALPDGSFFNVKRYKKPIFPNRIVYAFFRTPKAVRAYRYAGIIRECGFETPTPVAYIIESNCGLLGYTYLVTLHMPGMRDFYEFGSGDTEGRRDIIDAFARYTAAMHQAGIYHKDYSPGNILFCREAEGWKFVLVDINRMKFGRVSFGKGCKNFARLWGNDTFFRYIAEEYARSRGFDPAICRRLIFKYRDAFWKNR